MPFGLEVLLLFLKNNLDLQITILDLQFDIAPFWELFSKTLLHLERDFATSWLIKKQSFKELQKQKKPPSKI
ncbi:hypothetical protein GCM10010992_24640 [Cloacibacterium rupense]|uniref:Uncharacterized protein n=1 Tax=Cloacibacterium rupense TaxID=517423 RepID=A0ABQ2NSG7_9FLAO|nr:hypothetical protein GCM10010992_24640 [Cloacibacterium rupense]